MRTCLASVLTTMIVLTSTPSAAEEDCAKRFENYGLFLQAKKSCARDTDYPHMKIMKACAKQTSQETAISLMDGGRRTWARGVMRTSLGDMCEEVFSKLSEAVERRNR